VRAAARAHPDLVFAAANADYRLPFADGALDLVVSVKGPKNPSEFARVLAPGGHLVLAVPGADDLAELRRATAGAALERDPAARALELHREKFELVRRTQARERIELAQGVLDDLLLASYRGARHREAERARELASLDVTLAAEVLVLRRLPGEPGVG
jgi:23S rRNA (guanine745-N1)-methyltransferase